jgi:hypothetical protein
MALAALTALGGPAAQVEGVQAQPQVEELLLDVGGRSVRALCTPGAPEVILLQDAGDGPEVWRAVLERLPAGVSACAYDRRDLLADASGTVRERGWFELLEELVAAHRALGPRAGYVVVAQGEAAMYARLLAASRRAPVGGLVLLEPTHESLPRLIRPGLPEEDWLAWMGARAGPNEDGIPPVTLAARARGARLPGIPVTVVTADLRPAGPGWDVRFLDEAARRAHEEIVRGRPFGRHVPAPGSGPDIARDAPSLVADEILRVLRIAEGM